MDRLCEHLPFHQLPTDSDRRHQWLVGIKKPIKVSPYTHTCTLHFKDNKKTSSNDIPTILPWITTTTTTTTRKSCSLPFYSPEPKKHKQEVDSSKQIQEYATCKSLTKLQLECSKLVKELQRVSQELENIKISHVERFGA